MNFARARLIYPLVVLLSLLSPALARAGSLVVRDGDQDVTGGVLELGGKGHCCGSGPCHGNFRIDNTGTVALGRIDFSVTDLVGPAATIPAADVDFSPASLPRLGAEGTKVITLRLKIAASLPAGRYRGTVTIAESGTAERVDLPVEAVVCGGTGPAALAIVLDSGTELVFAAGPAGCSGSSFGASFAIEATGDEAIAAATPELTGLPAGSVVRFDPPVTALAPGARAAVRVALELAGGVAPGTYRATLVVTDPASGARDEAAAVVTRCATPKNGLRIVPAPGGIVFAPGVHGCAGFAFAATVAVESLADHPLAGVRLTLGDLSAGVVPRVVPASADLAPGARASFRIELLVPPTVPAGKHALTLRAANAGDESSDQASAALTRCESGRTGLRLLALDGGSEIVFTPAADGCSGRAFQASIAVESLGSTALAEVRLGALGMGEGVTVSFTPERFRLEAGGRAVVAATLLAPEGVVAGRFAGRIEAHAGLEPKPLAGADASFTRCSTPGEARLAIVQPEGQDAIELAPGAGGCAGDGFSAAIVIENRGAVPLARVELVFPGAQRALLFTTEPRAVAIAPGARSEIRVGVTGASLLAAGVWTTAVSARDAATGAVDTAVLRFSRCDAPRVVEPETRGDPHDPLEPVDEVPVRLTLEHESSKGAARSGEVLTLTSRVRNAGPGRVTRLTLEEHLPAGLVYVRGRSAVGGRAHPDPSGTRLLSWTLGALGPGDETELAFQAVVSPRAPLGPIRARAEARAAGARSGPVEVAIEITRSSLRPFGEVRGRVRYERGGAIAGVRLLLDSDRELASDEDGRFVFDGVLGGEHLVSLDGRSLPAGDRLSGDDSRLVRLFDGQSEEVEFVLRARPAPSLALYRIGTPADK